MDLSSLDIPEILEVVFPLAYSPFESNDFYRPLPSVPPDFFVKVEDGIEIGVHFWSAGKTAPNILFFHGNGETAAEYESISPIYNGLGINLFVADYRGYGASNGKPTIAKMFSDCHQIFQTVQSRLTGEGFSPSIFVMGRSLGSMSAIELAYAHQDEIKGLIIESGSANNFRRLSQNLNIGIYEALFAEDSLFLNKVKIKYISIPTLIIHGQFDELVPLEEGKELYAGSVASRKELLIIPGAGHNDIMIRNTSLYFGMVQRFVS